MQGANANRAWSLTGPYGTGKSAFAVFAANLFGNPKSAGARTARSLLKDGDPKLSNRLWGRRQSLRGGLAPIGVSATREPIQYAILRGLERSFSHHLNGQGRKLVKEIRDSQKRIATGKEFKSSRIVEFLASGLERISRLRNGPRGAFLIVDELGRLLEYANHRPEQSDLAVLQDIAEFAARSERPLLFMTILHQSFGAYATRIPAERRAEWQKIQGRFEDIPFEEPAEEMLRLIARATEVMGIARSRLSDREFARLAKKAWELGLAPGAMAKSEFTKLLRCCAPLHPAVAVMLGTVFRRLAQNERSAFSFLCSQEPFGLQEFIGTSCGAAPLYGVDRFHDYLTHAVRDGLYGSAQGKRWAEIETVLGDLRDAKTADAFLVKSIGLVNALGTDGRVKASREVIRFTSEKASTKTVTNADIDRLIRKSTVVERRYNGTLALWEGSDVDLDAEVRQADQRLDTSVPAASIANRYSSPRPLVAKRHSFVTGTLRYFPVRFMTVSELSATVETSEEPLSVAIVVPESTSEVKRAVASVRSNTTSNCRGHLFGVPREHEGFAANLREIAALQWVREHVKALEGDRTARRELAVRIEGLRQQLSGQFAHLLAPELNAGSLCRWFCDGKEIRFRGRKRLQDVLSEICDEVYPKSPHIRNELLNRRELSSAAAAARRNLIERMFQHRTEANLGIQGNPPEKSMHLSLLQESGLHRRTKDGWDFRMPAPSAKTHVRPVWDAVVRFFKETEAKARPVSTLFDRLSAPPYGVVAGPLPVLFCAAMLVHDNEVALYRDGTFIPDPGVPDFELLVKQPDRYTVQRWRVTGVRSMVFRKMAELLGRDLPADKIGKPEILQLVRPLLRFFKGLNDHTLYTKSLSDAAVNVRQALRKASEPDAMLFVDLPRACGLQAFGVRRRSSAKQVNRYVERLRGALTELQSAYDRLLDDVLGLIRVSFGLDGDLTTVRAELCQRAGLLVDSCGDPTLKRFLNRVLEANLDDRQWLEAVAGVVVIRLPAVWRDGDLGRFQQEIVSVARIFRHVETLVLATHGRTSRRKAEAIRIGVTTTDAPDAEQIVLLNKRQAVEAAQLEKRLEETLRKTQSADIKDRDIVLAALARVAKRRLDG